MSFMIFVQFFENDESAEVETSRITRIFGSAYTSEGGLPQLKYAADEFPELYGEFGNQFLSDFSVASPPVSIEFWSALYEVLRIEGAVLLIPELEGVVAANTKSERHLPSDMLSALPNFVHVSSPMEIMELVKNA